MFGGFKGSFIDNYLVKTYNELKRILDKTAITLKTLSDSFSSHSDTNATSSVSGHMTADDKKKLDGVTEGATKSPLSNSASMAVAGTYALDAVQANASVSGTLANKIAEHNTNIANHNHDSRYYTESEVNSLLSQKAGLELLAVTDIAVTTNPNLPIAVFSCTRYGKLVVFSFSLKSNKTGSFMTIAQLTGVTAARTTYAAVNCYGGAEAEVSINAGGNTVILSASSLNGEGKAELVFICN